MSEKELDEMASTSRKHLAEHATED
ncbi:DUF3008 family protein [Hoeflea sp. G2-23]|uniref:DUF3008 family protein n=1 Tax=Hoeflea algicola TaxID=2983763 RepID=A0ABT3Z5S0_9HYPH|nr:DUF3008 family protein [Hoeflea algicola]MCY0147113.1 DUF3008 family protein [Hoeflea algicola]